MTREEAVNELNDKIKSAEYVDSDYIDCVSVDAVKMAISALSVPETNVGDTISRQAAIETAMTMYERCTTEDIADLRDLICESLAVLPKVDAVKVVRCKDCQWWDDNYRECGSPNWYPDQDGCVLQPAGMFCGWAERRTDDT